MVAIQMLRDECVLPDIVQGLTVPFALQSQIYSIVTNRTQADIELVRFAFCGQTETLSQNHETLNPV